MHLEIYLRVFNLFIVGQLSSADQRRLPHQSCLFSALSEQTMILTCDRNDLVLPDNFDVIYFPSNVVDIRLECPSHHTNNYCNVIKSQAQPFPALPQLVSVALYGFRGEAQGRFPVNHLLTNVKHRIEDLDVRNSKIGILDREVLSGFSALKILTLGGNDINAVALDAFESLPALHEIHLGHNQIREFDWSALEPLADTLMDIGINSQNPRLLKLHRSGPPFTLKKLNYFTMIGNRLSSIPKEVLDTIPKLDMMSDNRTIVRVEGNAFCPADPNCSCCEMEDFFTWLDNVKKAAKPGQNIDVRYSCGSQGQYSLHQLLIDNGAVGYSVGADGNTLKAAEFLPFVSCVTMPTPTVATTVKTFGTT